MACVCYLCWKMSYCPGIFQILVFCVTQVSLSHYYSPNKCDSDCVVNNPTHLKRERCLIRHCCTKSFANREAAFGCRFLPVLTLVLHIITSLYEYMTDLHSRPQTNSRGRGCEITLWTCEMGEGEVVLVGFFPPPAQMIYKAVLTAKVLQIQMLALGCKSSSCCDRILYLHNCF